MAEIFTSYDNKMAHMQRNDSLNIILVSNGVYGKVTGATKYSKLMPDWDDDLKLNRGKITRHQHDISYLKKLNKLNPRKIVKSITKKGKTTILVGIQPLTDKNGWKSPLIGWLNENLSMDIQEY